MTDKTFTFSGVSTGPNGQPKVRFTNDLTTRIKILVKGGHDDIDIRELPSAMTKPEAVTFLMEQADFEGTARMAIEDANDKYNVVSVKKSKAKAKKDVSTPSATKVSKEAPVDTAETAEA